MTQQLVLVGAFLAGLAALPWALRWLRGHIVPNVVDFGGQNRFISVVAVGPNQRVVTVEVGPEHARVWLTLGVTVQSVALLHTASIGTQVPRNDAAAAQPELHG